ncbi:Zinc transporter [Brachionus plicatilis]|uniref:Zinc transporter n=1 Tax=Brachionus plicatilis TaxID=10195 RepID=A0A3M7Q367_BRAPC|nr:Zinc transporter [Brachionus plicatilis]
MRIQSKPELLFNNGLGEHTIFGGVGARLARHNQLGYLTARKPLTLGGQLLALLHKIKAVQLNLARTSARLQQILVKIAGQAKAHNLIQAIIDGIVKLLGLIARQNKHELVGLLAGPVQKGVEGGAQVLADLFVSSLSQERVCLVHKEEEAASAGGRPVEHLVYGRDALAAHWRHISARQNGVVHA